jgi:hypothetical protein
MFVYLFILSLTSVSHGNVAPETDLEKCKARAEFQYHFDMMQIEREELQSQQLMGSAFQARKQTRHLLYVGELAVCQEEHGKK